MNDTKLIVMFRKTYDIGQHFFILVMKQLLFIFKFETFERRTKTVMYNFVTNLYLNFCKSDRCPSNTFLINNKNK